MNVKPMVVIAAILLLAGCGDRRVDSVVDNRVDVSADNGTNGGVDNGVDYEIPGPEPFPPSTCQCSELRRYVAGLPLIGDLFADAEITLNLKQLRMQGAPAGPDPEYSELIELLGDTIPGINVSKESQIGVYPQWRLYLNPDPADTDFGSWLLLEDIDVTEFEGIKDPDSYDPDGVAAIEAEAIATLADLEAALISIQESSVP